VPTITPGAHLAVRALRRCVLPVENFCCMHSRFTSCHWAICLEQHCHRWAGTQCMCNVWERLSQLRCL
jgi:hypothetical protein